MTHIRTLWLISAVALCACAQDAQLDPKSESSLIAAADEVQKAIQSDDESTLHKRLADDFFMVHGNGGAIVSRERFISSLRSGGRTPSSDLTIYDRVIRVISSGIVLMTETLNLRQRNQSRWYTVTSVWRKRSDHWQCLYGQRALMGEGISPNAENLASYGRIVGRYRTSDGLEFSVSVQQDRLLMDGLRSMERPDVLIPQGDFEFQVNYYRLKFHVDDTQTSATALSNQTVLWTAKKTR